MTPIQQAIEQVKARINESNTPNYRVALIKSVQILQSLLPVEKEWAMDVWVTSNQEASNYPHALDFEQYYSQFNEVK